ncbi:hypothetical protein GCM10009863_04660 [Streptomyces axinellae]|uniref:Secreted protein n=1 Tax=Streptomyces axinellae TaxID=552788 RepID=A0ABN3PPT8_9ACTN
MWARPVWARPVWARSLGADAAEPGTRDAAVPVGPGRGFRKAQEAEPQVTAHSASARQLNAAPSAHGAPAGHGVEGGRGQGPGDTAVHKVSGR